MNFGWNVRVSILLYVSKYTWNTPETPIIDKMEVLRILFSQDQNVINRFMDVASKGTTSMTINVGYRSPITGTLKTPIG